MPTITPTINSRACVASIYGSPSLFTVWKEILAASENRPHHNVLSRFSQRRYCRPSRSIVIPSGAELPTGNSAQSRDLGLALLGLASLDWLCAREGDKKGSEP